ncbi:hypothetical protein EV421DRAFT_1743849 [Armillaria borealis]|uniref:Uncharacterized protein n=1 Tax=Armillaria borealis TaxID=47425 RepID=A0AA39MDV0_9AGAR|nr:hypothetical protein EV421DRAFT_1743849 [Armillaria borealis]
MARTYVPLMSSELGHDIEVATLWELETWSPDKVEVVEHKQAQCDGKASMSLTSHALQEQVPGNTEMPPSAMKMAYHFRGSLVAQKHDETPPFLMAFWPTNGKHRFIPNLLELILASHLDVDFGGEFPYEFKPHSYWNQIAMACHVAPTGMRIEQWEQESASNTLLVLLQFDLFTN